MHDTGHSCLSTGGMRARRVLFKQRNNCFFPPTAYAVSLLLVRIPFQLVEAMLYSVIVYFWVGAWRLSTASCLPSLVPLPLPAPNPGICMHAERQAVTQMSRCTESNGSPEHQMGAFCLEKHRQHVYRRKKYPQLQLCRHGAGFHRGVREFFLYYLICFSAMLVNSALYRLLASALPNLDVATAGGALRKPARSLRQL